MRGDNKEDMKSSKEGSKMIVSGNLPINKKDTILLRRIEGGMKNQLVENIETSVLFVSKKEGMIQEIRGGMIIREKSNVILRRDKKGILYQRWIGRNRKGCR